ncbi:DUF948 domain-containing protein [Aneurinibacillus tyrosinisolvens]|uniref:DUF948 domain-containing protein n=1 Tax=Aneurinibacillus tyrosinisolvens TaxID=1443435 RepID=UPI00063F3B82|nr:DUF948 domain-containing protein [Aneurinibacillus tyrosinisolvens]
MQTAMTIGVSIIAIAMAVLTVYMVIFFKNLIPLVKHADDTVQQVQGNLNRLMASVDISLSEINRISGDIAEKMDKLDSSFEAVDSIGRGVTLASESLQDKVLKKDMKWTDKMSEWTAAGFSIYQGIDKLRKKTPLRTTK